MSGCRSFRSADGRFGVPFVLFLTVGLVGFGCGGAASESVAPPDAMGEVLAVEVTVASPSREDIVRRVTLPVTIEAYERTTLYSKVSGYLREISVDVGDRVDQGRLIGTIEVPELEDRLRAAEAEQATAMADREGAIAARKLAEADLSLQETTYKRLSAVNEQEPDALSEQDFDEARTNLDTAKAQVQVAKSRIEQAQGEIKRSQASVANLRTLLGFSKIVAPLSGVVTERFVDRGALLQQATSSQMAQRIVTIERDDPVRIWMDVPEAETPMVDVGDPMVMTVDALPGREFQGGVTRYSASLDPATRTMKTVVDLPNPGRRLRPGMYGLATLTLDVRKDAITIPAEALRYEGSASYVLGVQDGRVRKIDVVAAVGDGIAAEVLSGLNGSERIVVGSQGSIADGDSVRIVGAGAEAGQ